MLNILFGISFTLNIVVALVCFILYKTKIKSVIDIFNVKDRDNIFCSDKDFWNDLKKEDINNEET